jgi:hypothetical protein
MVFQPEILLLIAFPGLLSCQQPCKPQNKGEMCRMPIPWSHKLSRQRQWLRQKLFQTPLTGKCCGQNCCDHGVILQKQRRPDCQKKGGSAPVTVEKA